VDGLWATKSKDVGLIVRAISFQDFQRMWSWSVIVTDGQTTCNLSTALCTIVHRAAVGSVREYVFFVFFQISKNMTFYVFLKCLWKKR